MKLGSLTLTCGPGDYARVQGAEFWVRRGRCKVTVSAPKSAKIEKGYREPKADTRSAVRAALLGCIAFLAGLVIGGAEGKQERTEDASIVAERMPVSVPVKLAPIPRIEQQFQAGVGQRNVRLLVGRDREPRDVEQIEVVLQDLGHDRQIEYAGSIGSIDRFQNAADDFVGMCSHGIYPIVDRRGERQHRGYRPMALRVHAGDPDGPGNPATVTLREAYESYLYPKQNGRRAKKTPQAYRTAVTHWEAFVAARCRATLARRSTISTPAPQSLYLSEPIDLVSQITDQMLNDWGIWLMAEDGAQLSLGTAKKQWRCVRAILRRVGPRESGNPSGLGYLAEVPTMDPLDELAEASDREGPQDVTDEQLDRIHEACEVARWPEDEPVLQWQTYLVVLSVMGPRVNDAATLEACDFSFDASSPVARSSRTYDHGWMVYRPTKTRRKKPAKLIVPLPPCVRAHVQALISQRGGRLFSWRDSTGHKFRDTWNAIVGQAGLSHVERRHLRSTANIRWERAGGNRQLGRWVLGHAARDVNDEHYMRAEPDLIEAAPHVVVPKRFDLPPGHAPRQLYLFG